MQLAGIVQPRREQFERVLFDACPLCEAHGMRPLKSVSCTQHKLYDSRFPPTIEWLECAECRHVFTNGHFGKQALEVLFSKTQPSQEPGADIERQREIAAEMIDRVAVAMGIESGNWLDVGFGSGALFTTADEYGFRATGLDLRYSSVQALCYLGYDARCIPLESLKGQTFDVISMCDVVEHVPQPKELLRAARERMNPDGALLISMPNADSCVWRMLDLAKSNPYWAELEHYHNFTRESLYRLLEQTGFKPVSYGISKRYRACMEVIARAA